MKLLNQLSVSQLLFVEFALVENIPDYHHVDKLLNFDVLFLIALVIFEHQLNMNDDNHDAFPGMAKPFDKFLDEVLSQFGRVQLCVPLQDYQNLRHVIQSRDQLDELLGSPKAKLEQVDYYKENVVVDQVVGSDPSPAHLGIVVVQKKEDKLFQVEALLIVQSQNLLSVAFSHVVSDFCVKVEFVLELNSISILEVAVEVEIVEAEHQKTLDSQAAIIDVMAVLKVLVFKVEKNDVQGENLLEDLSHSELFVDLCVEGGVEQLQKVDYSGEVGSHQVHVLLPAKLALPHELLLSVDGFDVNVLVFHEGKNLFNGQVSFVNVGSFVKPQRLFEIIKHYII